DERRTTFVGAARGTTTESVRPDSSAGTTSGGSVPPKGGAHGCPTNELREDAARPGQEGQSSAQAGAASRRRSARTAQRSRGNANRGRRRRRAVGAGTARPHRADPQAVRERGDLVRGVRREEDRSSRSTSDRLANSR